MFSLKFAFAIKVMPRILKMEKNIKIYSRPGCSYCEDAKFFFEKNGIYYEEINIDEDEGRLNEMLKKSGQLGVPVIEISGDIVIGFNPEKLKKLKGGKSKMRYIMACDDGFVVESESKDEASSLGAMHVLIMHPTEKISGREMKKMVKPLSE